MSNGHTNHGTDFITARELNMAVTFLSQKLDDGFRVTHEKQDHTNGRLLKAEDEIQQLKASKMVDRAVENIAEKARTRMETWKVTVLTSIGTSAMGGVAYLVKKAFGF